MYSVLVVSFMSKSRDVMEKRNVNGLVSRMRQDKQVRLGKEFPGAIEFTATLLFKDRLKKVRVEQVENVSDKTCFLDGCYGKLVAGSRTFQCNICDTGFCPECEMTYSPGHTCDPTEVESVRVKNGNGHCPECMIPIEKNGGCDHMTCKHCGTHYSEQTGKVIEKYKRLESGLLERRFPEQEFFEMTRKFSSLVSVLNTAQEKILRPEKLYKDLVTYCSRNYVKNQDVAKRYVDYKRSQDTARKLIKLRNELVGKKKLNKTSADTFVSRFYKILY